jgi:signal transduction histidine kinase/CheY-like chemotaxis protein
MDKIGKQQGKILKGRTVVAVVAGVAVLLVLLVTLSLVFFHRMDEKTFEERRLHLMEFTEEVSEIIEETVRATWKEVNACEYILDRDSVNITDTEQLMDEMEFMTSFESIDDALILAFDDQGNYYSSDGNSGHWNKNELLDMEGPKGTQAVVQIPHRADDSYLLFLDKLDKSVVMPEAGIRVTHLAVAANTASLDRLLNINSFGNECYTYIINNDGNRLYQSNFEDFFIRGDNVLDALRGYNVMHGDDFDTIAEAVGKEESTAVEFRYTSRESGEERDWFAASANVRGIGWQIVLFVPTDVLGANTDDILSVMTHYFIAISTITIIIFILMIFAILASRADKRIIREKEDSNRLLREAVEKAENASVAKSDFLSRMSHDIRTPINAIMGMTGIAQKYIDDKDRVKDCLAKIDSSSQHLFKLINDVLDMSRIEAGKTTLVVEPFDLCACMDNCADIIEGQLVGRNIELVRDFDNLKNRRVLGDELHLRQVFINILGNAVKFTHDGGRIYFRARQIEMDERNAYMFIIQDTGVGMKQEYIPHLFEAFSQEDGGARTTYKGTGLGMTITKQFVDMMGGTIEVDSVLNTGTRFEIRVPMDIDDGAETAVEEHDTELDIKGMKILLVEDNELNLEIAQEILTEQGVEITTARNGKFAAETFRAVEPGTFDAILMDIMMPVMDGISATKAIRALDRADAKTIPIIAMTANAYDEDIKRTQEAGMNGHLSKPVDVGKLYAALAECYSRGKA